MPFANIQLLVMKKMLNGAWLIVAFALQLIIGGACAHETCLSIVEAVGDVSGG